MSARLLIVSDDAERQRALTSLLARTGVEMHVVRNRHEAVRAIAAEGFALVLVDLISKGSCGVSIAQYLRDCFSLAVVVVRRNPSDSRSFVAFSVDGCAAPCYTNAGEQPLLDVVINLVTAERRRPKGKHSIFNERHGRDTRAEGNMGARSEPHATLVSTAALLLGDSIEIKLVRARIADVADSDLTVLIRGESGTGKTVAARLIHETSYRRCIGNLSRINCPALPESLLESELFGYEKGAFTGAERQKPGRLELAARGTLFLDEVGAISLGVQAKLLEVLEAKQYFRVGGREPIHMDARIVAATNGYLEEQIRLGSFRADLMYRLNQFTIRIPPLRERACDIPLLVEHFLRVYGIKYDHPNLTVPDELMGQLQEYPWPGNVRELETGIGRFCLTGNISLITEILDGSPSPERPENGSMDLLHDAERKAVRDALNKSHWNQRKAAAALGISYSALRRRIAKYGILCEV